MAIGEELYDSTASFGRFWALLSAIIGTLIGVVLIIGGIYLLVKKQDRDAIEGKIIKINGSETGQCQNSDVLTCILTIQYAYNGQNYVSDIDYNGKTMYFAGQTATVYVLQTDPHSATVEQPVPKWMGGVLLGFGLLIALGGWFWYWASTKWKVVAAAEGAGGLLKVVSGGRW